MKVLHMLSKISARHRLTQAATTSLLRGIQQTTEVLRPGLADFLPTDASSLQTVLQGYALNLYRYYVCLSCGRLRRKELCNTEYCVCGKQKWEKDIYIDVFCPVEWLERIIKCKPLLELLQHENRRVPDNTLNDCFV